MTSIFCSFRQLFPALFLLLLTLAGCDMKYKGFVGTWETENYNAYLDIKMQGDIFMVSIKEKNNEPDWLYKKVYIMNYDNGILRSDLPGFKTITLDPKNNTLRINEEKDDWHRITNESAM